MKLSKLNLGKRLLGLLPRSKPRRLPQSARDDKSAIVADLETLAEEAAAPNQYDSHNDQKKLIPDKGDIMLKLLSFDPFKIPDLGNDYTNMSSGSLDPLRAKTLRGAEIFRRLSKKSLEAYKAFLKNKRIRKHTDRRLLQKRIAEVRFMRDTVNGAKSPSTWGELVHKVHSQAADVIDLVKQIDKCISDEKIHPFSSKLTNTEGEIVDLLQKLELAFRALAVDASRHPDDHEIKWFDLQPSSPIDHKTMNDPTNPGKIIKESNLIGLNQSNPSELV